MSSSFVADEKLVVALTQATGPLTVCKADGQVIGYVTPARPTQGFMEPPFSEEEIERAMNDPNAKYIPAAEVEAKIRELKCTR